MREFPCAHRYAAAVLMPFALLVTEREVHAQRNEPVPSGFTGSVAAVTDYVDRGISQSRGHGAIQSEILWQDAAGRFASVWASTVDFDDDEAQAEVDFILGVERDLRGVLVSLAASYIHYAGAASNLEYDLVEFNTRAEMGSGPYTFTAEAIFSPSNSGDAGRALYMMTGASRELTDELSLGVFMGRQWIEREDIAGRDHNSWGIGLEWTRGRYSATLGYTGTDADESCGDICSERVAAGIALAL